MENLKAFCNDTSLHGWKYVTQKSQIAGFWTGFSRCFWLVMILLSMGLAGIFLFHNTRDFLAATVVTTVDTLTVPLSETYFPSVVVCNLNQVRKSFFAELEIDDDQTLVDELYSNLILGKVPSKEKSRHDQIMKKYLAKKGASTFSAWFAHQECRDAFILSSWNQTKTYGFPISRDFGTDAGICCWFTPQINFTEVDEHVKANHLDEPDWGMWFAAMPKGSKAGKDNGYKMVFDIESFDYSDYNEGSVGLNIALIHHLDMPIMRQVGFHVGPGTQNQVAITPILMSTTTNALQRFSPEERDCFGEEEISLKYLPRDHGYRYDMGNCLFEAAFENILSTCNCVPGFHMMGGDEAIETKKICAGEKLTCMNNIINRIGEFDQVEYQGKLRKCRSACEDQVNSVFMSHSSYPGRNTFTHHEEFCILTKRLLQKCKSHKRKSLLRTYPNLCNLIQPLENIEFCPGNVWKAPKQLNCSSPSCPMVDAIYEYAKDNLAMLNIYVKDLYAKRFIKDEKITLTSFLANSGGLLCVCMGFSLISAVEILYHCIVGILLPMNRVTMRPKDDIQL